VHGVSIGTAAVWTLREMNQEVANDEHSQTD
jgi:hypothetical protein